MLFYSDFIASTLETVRRLESEAEAARVAQQQAEQASQQGLRCVIRAERPIDALAAARPAFASLPDYLPDRSRAIAWNGKYGQSHDLMVVALGKTGYGKSTTLNRLLGESAFETSHISGCTRQLQSVEYRFDADDQRYHCSFADLPGLGESRERDVEYYPLYRKTLAAAHVVLYFVRADQRDYSVDQRAFAELVALGGNERKVILVLNAIDKLEPLNRSLPFALSREQTHALGEKVKVLRTIFDIPETSIVPISGAEDYHLNWLGRMIVERLAPSLVRM